MGTLIISHLALIFGKEHHQKISLIQPNLVLLYLTHFLASLATNYHLGPYQARSQTSQLLFFATLSSLIEGS